MHPKPRTVLEDKAIKTAFALLKFSRRIAKSVQPTFIVGCGHSGTSLLHEQLGNHSKILKIENESRVFSGPNIDERGLKSRGLALLIFFSWNAKALIRNKKVFLEKTPNHIEKTEQIEHYFPGSKFLLVFREPRDTVASMVARGATFSDAMGRYEKSNEIGLSLAKRQNVFLVPFENLILSNNLTLTQTCEFLGIPMDPQIVKPTITNSPQLPQHSNHAERRRLQIRGPIYDSRGSWHRYLDLRQGAEVERRLGPIYRALYQEANLDPENPLPKLS